jgi:4-hydroxy-tetrahydrodipicolinate reductase
MRVVADRLGVEIERIDQEIEPILAERELAASSMTVATGRTAGFRQHYVAIVAGRPWFEALFTGHVAPSELGLEPRDAIHVEGPAPLHFAVTPGMNPQSGSAAIIANSIRRVVAARPGWVTVGELPPAIPR